MALMKEVNEKVYKIIGACMEVHKKLGPGYPVEFYKQALETELIQKEMPHEAGKSIQVLYKEALIGTQQVDFVVAGDVVMMIKSQDGLQDVEIQQVLRYLSLLSCSVGILVNFGLSKIQYKRIMPSHQNKDIQKQPYRVSTYREIGRTREGNPIS